MILERAREIIDSPRTIHVYHNGNPIWIEKLDAERNVALITTRAGQINVPVDELMES